MDDATALIAGQTKKYSIPLSHFEHKYIQTCTNGKELERIYKELIGGEIGSFPALEELTLDRIREIKPNSPLLRQDKAPLDQSSIPDNERRELNDFINEMKQNNGTTLNSNHQNNGIDSLPIRSSTKVNKPTTTSAPSVPITKNHKNHGQSNPKSYDEWAKLEQKISKEFKSDNEDSDDDDEETRDTTSRSEVPYEKSQRCQMAEQHRLNGNKAYKSNNYQQAIDLYTKSIMLDSTNMNVYTNRALCHFKLDHIDASITDCSHVLTTDRNNIKALFRRATCFVSKQQYNEAKLDLDVLLTIEPQNSEALNLLNTIPKSKSIRVPITDIDGEDESVDSNNNKTQTTTATSLKIPIVEIEEEEEEEEMNIEPKGINIPTARLNLHTGPCIDSKDASPAMSDHMFDAQDDVNEFDRGVRSHLSTSDGGMDDDDDEDDMALGDEAGGGVIGNMSDDEANISRGMNVSPTLVNDDDGDDAPELVDHKPLRTPPLTPPSLHSIDGTYSTTDFQAIPISQKADDYDDLYGNNNMSSTTSSGFQSSFRQQQQQQTNSSNNPFDNDDDDDNIRTQKTPTSSNNTDGISQSNFGLTIQNWLRDLIYLQTGRRSSLLSDRPWSRCSRPWSLDKLQRDIDGFNRHNDYRNTIETAKKMLKNGILDYHSHAEHIVHTLVLCAQCYAKTNDHVHAAQYASEALQYNKFDSSALICRAKAFENEKLPILSYADYSRVPIHDFSSHLTQRACEKLIIELNESQGETWREKLPNDDDENRFLSFIKTKISCSIDDQYEWYRTRANQLYLDACFILAIRCYTRCIELKPKVMHAYGNRCACYLKVFEPQKAIEDCDMVLKDDSRNLRTLYRKACAYKMARNDRLYQLTLKEYLRLKPNNQIVLAEYYNYRHEPIPRQMRRIRTGSFTQSMPSTPIEDKTTKSKLENNLTFDELEQLRTKNTGPISVNTPYQFTQQLTALKSTDLKSQCALVLRLPPKNLFKLASSATPKLVESIAMACRTMVHAEQRYQQQNKSAIVRFSYIHYCFNILVELTAIPRLDSSLSMIDTNARAALDDLLSYYSSSSSLLFDVDKLSRLRLQ